ncbi:MAG: UDP-N-acetylglucosamine--N-acetylmuramyl-(pentapeptide) pyrophosphoryl-undecaprenol N-acetylglucosamine transferase [Egibacteraceae bacterium]
MITGGNTGGHVIPNLPLIEQLGAAGWSVHYIGDPNGLEARLVPPLKIPFHPLKTGKLRRYSSIRNLTDLPRTILAIFRAAWVLSRFRPQLIYSKGGFVSVPVIIAGRLLRIPIVAHESDRTLSLTGRIAIRVADKLCCGLPSSIKSDKLVYTGIPLRRDIKTGWPSRVHSELRLRGSVPVLLVVGGSLGAAALGRALGPALPNLLPAFDIIHLSPTGAPVVSPIPPGYHPIPNDYKRFPDLLAAADVVLSRAGATVIAELLAVNKPALLVPLPTTASRGEQLANAHYYQEAGYGECLEQHELTSAALEKMLHLLLEHADHYRALMAHAQIPDATDAVLRVINEILARHNSRGPSVL